MVRIDIAPELVEEAVFQVLSPDADRGDPRAVAWLEERERLYELPRGAEREAAFRSHALTAFRRLHCDEPLRLALAACPSAMRRLDVLFVRRAARRKEESAELFCAGDPLGDGCATRAVLPLTPGRFRDSVALHELALCELLHVDDMLDERFGYAPDALDRLALDPGQRDVVRERVGRAWRARVEARARGESCAQAFPDLVAAALSSLRQPAAQPGR